MDLSDKNLSSSRLRDGDSTAELPDLPNPFLDLNSRASQLQTRGGTFGIGDFVVVGTRLTKNKFSGQIVDLNPATVRFLFVFGFHNEIEKRQA